ncbi:MAG: hypothetical protein J0H74_36695 [Chitinophagaceae bacterium]|nr:hypothetical protein [Chitinophagaceae bacterium]
MRSPFLQNYKLDHIEILTPMARTLAYWHVKALGFHVTAYSGMDTGRPGFSSFVCRSGDVCLVLTSTYPMLSGTVDDEVQAFINKHYCGVKRVSLLVDSVGEAFNSSIRNGAIPVQYPRKLEDGDGVIEEAAIKLYEDNEIVFINRSRYQGVFKPGYARAPAEAGGGWGGAFTSVDHIAAEVRINESQYWSEYLANAVGTSMVQSIGASDDNKTGMILKINQTSDRLLTFVIAEPESYLKRSKVQKNIETFGPGIHHLAFATKNLQETVRVLSQQGVEFVSFPPSYYDLLRKDNELHGSDIAALQRHGILLDKEGDSYLLQKFIKPISDRPFFLYEIVERVNGYSGFALKNINVLKQAEELEIMSRREQS